jgi:hypothetical protein
LKDESKPGGLLPFVRHLIVCEHAEAASHNPRRANLFGVLANVVLPGESAHFPCGFGFSVYVMLSECRGDGVGRIIVSEAESGETIHSGTPHRILVGRDPLEVHGVIFRIYECMLPRPGLYWIEFEFDGAILWQEPILVVVR